MVFCDMGLFIWKLTSSKSSRETDSFFPQCRLSSLHLDTMESILGYFLLTSLVTSTFLFLKSSLHGRRFRIHRFNQPPIKKYSAQVSPTEFAFRLQMPWGPQALGQHRDRVDPCLCFTMEDRQVKANPQPRGNQDTMVPTSPFSLQTSRGYSASSGKARPQVPPEC